MDECEIQSLIIKLLIDLFERFIFIFTFNRVMFQVSEIAMMVSKTCDDLNADDMVRVPNVLLYPLSLSCSIFFF